MKINLKEIPALFINLDKDIEKRNSIEKELSHFGFSKIIRIPGVVHNESKVGCSRAQYDAITYPINPPFIIFEDDCKIKNFTTEIEIPDDAHAVYLGISSWARMNSHSGPFLQYEKINNDIYRIYNMLSTHCILYLEEDFVKMCRRIFYHAGYIANDFPDIGVAEIQKYFKIYAVNNPLFYQTSSQGTNDCLINYKENYNLNYDSSYWKPTYIK